MLYAWKCVLMRSGCGKQALDEQIVINIHRIPMVD